MTAQAEAPSEVGTGGASISPARTIGPMLGQQIAEGTMKWSQVPVYRIAELLAAAPSTDSAPVPVQATDSPATI